MKQSNLLYFLNLNVFSNALKYTNLFIKFNQDLNI